MNFVIVIILFLSCKNCTCLLYPITLPEKETADRLTRIYFQRQIIIAREKLSKSTGGLHALPITSAFSTKDPDFSE